VAVAGLPDPQEGFAVIMTKFASDCLFKMGQLTTELAHVMGADTADLALRVGLRSGSVTGGVLRGQKSRFQLFGDTMNTASHMESNGKAGRIHISEQTANELTAKGKSSWMTHRQDKVVVKGKGELWEMKAHASNPSPNVDFGRELTAQSGRRIQVGAA
jgi:class 3 adenylate cyclase